MTSLVTELSKKFSNYQRLKAGLDCFKSSKPDSNGFWEPSEQIFNRIRDKSEHVNYLLANRDVSNILF